MAPPHIIRPENIIKTCENLIRINKSDEALDTLKNFIGSRKFKFITAAQAESVGLLFVQLCVDLRDFGAAKEGLFNYKKNAQTINNGLETVGNVVRRFIQLGEESLSRAKESAAAAATETTTTDLDEVRSPEALLLSIVSSDDTKDRSDRELLTPHLRFMYDSYRTVLDTIRNTKQLEIVYCYIVSHAFKFCEQFSRKLEFKRLSDLIRTHLQSINFYANQQHTNAFHALNQIDLSNPSTLERFLQLRFNGLNIAVKLELYQESFKIVEDIHTLLVLSKRQPKPSMMLNYYENLAKIFNVSVNSLYRSVSWLKFFNLYSQSPNATLENLSNYASIIVLSSLSISELAGSNNDEERNKYNRLSGLLNLPHPPTRKSVIDSINNPNFLKFVNKDLRFLFNYLENDDFNPLFIQSELVPVLNRIYESSNYKVFFNGLLETILVKIFKQVAKNYENIRFEFLVDLANFKGTSYELSHVVVENNLINAGKDGLLPQFRIDHDANVVSFINDPFDVASANVESTAADLIKVQLSKLSGTLLKSLYNTDPSFIEQQQANKAKAIELANKEIERERQEIEERRILLEKRREEEAEEEARKQEEAKKLREEKLAAEKKAEKERLEVEAKRKMEEKIARERDEIREKEKLKIAEDINKAGIIHVDTSNIKDIDITELKQMQLDQLTKDQNDTQERLKALFKRNDHLERAYRKYELKLLEEDRKVQKQKDVEDYKLLKEKHIQKAKKEHEESLRLRDRLQRIVPVYESYRNKVDAHRAEQLAKQKEENLVKLEEEKQVRIKQLKAEKLAILVQQQQEEAERKLREEAEAKAEAIRAEAEAKAAAEKAEKDKKQKEEMEKLKAELAEQRKKDAELLAKQREREAEVERLLAEKQRGGADRPYRPARGGSRFGQGRDGTASPAANPRSFSGSASTPRSSESSSSPAPAPAPASGRPLTFAEKLKLKRMQKQQEGQ